MFGVMCSDLVLSNSNEGNNKRKEIRESKHGDLKDKPCNDHTSSLKNIRILNLEEIDNIQRLTDEEITSKVN